MPHPVIHAEIRSQDADATREFLGALFDWKVASEGGFPGYPFMDPGPEAGPPVAIGPRQGTDDEVLFFVAVDDVAATLSRAEELGGKVIQPMQQVPGVSFGVLADAHGHRIGGPANQTALACSFAPAADGWGGRLGAVRLPSLAPGSFSTLCRAPTSPAP